MGKTLTTYVNEAVKSSDVRLVDMEEIVYPDGKVIKIADVEEKFHTSCMYIFSAYAFFAPAVKALTPIITNEIDTMATDGIRIFMNPRFTAELTDTQCIFVILHECMHNILNHLTREKQNGFSDHERANIAADYEVNGILENDGIVKAGTTKNLGGFIDPKYNGWAFERIYNDPNMNKGGSSPKQQGNPQSGQGQPGSGSGQSGSGSGGNNNQPKPEDWIKGWNQALADYNSGKLKI